MKKTKILLTGAGGMVGQNLLEHPEIDKFEVIAPRSNELDLTNYNAVDAYVEKYQPDMVIHAAGKVGGIQANVREPVSFLVDNLDMGRNIVLASRRNGIKRLMNLGSSCMYPKNHTEPLVEDMVLKGELEPTNEGYAIAKIAIARLCDYVRFEDKSYHYKTLIPCNLYGRHDKFDPAHSHLIPAIIHKVHQAKFQDDATVEIWGDGLARREFMYAGDLANMMIKAVESFELLPSYMNLGLGDDYTINDYYHAAAEVIGFSGDFTHDTTRPVGMLRKLVNVDLQIAMGWQHKVGLKEGLKKTYDFYLKASKNEL
jgi:GDP-L-fucose synthase